ncbi:MAG: GDSL-type esterase/lipase family protein [Lachnospiraceae bacterium]|nr:GDSL-type esterase/lipase family protein [Lachnospiraceae bacterium]
MKRKLRCKILSLLMVAVMCIGLLPASVQGAEDAIVYVAAGDSITTGYGLDDKSSECYVTLFAEDIGADSTTNLGVDGLTAALLYTYLATGTYDTVIAYADVITITIGGNDLMAAFYEVVAEICTASGTTMDATMVQTILSDPVTYSTQALALYRLLNTEDAVTYMAGSTTLTSAIYACVQNVNNIASYIKSVNEDAVILIANQYNPYQWLSGCEYIVALFEAGVTAYNYALSVAQTSDYTLVDVYSAFAESGDTLTNAYFTINYATLSYDMNFDFHPNADGHAVIADAMAAAYESATAADDDSEDTSVTVTNVEVVELNADEFTVGDSPNLADMTILVTYSDDSTKTLTFDEGMDYLYDDDDYDYSNFIEYFLYNVVTYEEDGEVIEYVDSYWYGYPIPDEGEYLVGFIVSGTDSWQYIYTDTSVTISALLASSLENVTSLTLNETYTTNLEETGDWVWYSYTPEASGYYVFQSSNNYQEDNYVDPFVELYSLNSDGTLTYITYNDDYDDENFYLYYYLTEGVTYYFKTRSFMDSYVGLYDVELTSEEETTTETDAETVLAAAIAQLEAVIAEAEALNESDYSAEDWAAIQAALTSAQAVLADLVANGTDTSYTTTEILAIYQALTTAVTETETETTSEEDTSSTTEADEDESDTTTAEEDTTEAEGDTTEAEEETTATSTDGTDTASTGDSSTGTGDISTWIYFVLLIGAAAGAVLVAKKKEA